MAVKIWPSVAETAKITLFRYQRPNGAEFQAFTILPHSNWLGQQRCPQVQDLPVGLDRGAQHPDEREDHDRHRDYDERHKRRPGWRPGGYASRREPRPMVAHHDDGDDKRDEEQDAGQGVGLSGVELHETLVVDRRTRWA